MTPRSSAPDDSGNGSPDDLRRENPLIRAVERAVDKLEASRSYIEREIDIGRADMRDVRDRLGRLETKVDGLPSKTWIGFVVVGAMAFLSGLVAALAAIFTHLPK